MGRIEEIKKRIKTLKELILRAEEKREEVIILTKALGEELNSGKINKREYYDKLYSSLNLKTPLDWLKYYDDYILDCENRIKECERLIKEEKSVGNKAKRVKALQVSVFIMLGIVAVFLLNNFGTVIYEHYSNAGGGGGNISMIGTGELGNYKPFSISSADSNAVYNATTVQGAAIVGKKVKWESEVIMNSPEDFSIAAYPGSKVTKITDEAGNSVPINAKLNGNGKYIVEIESAGAIISKEIVEKSRERVKVSSPVHYQEILSSIKVSEKLRLKKNGNEKLHLYEIFNASGKETRTAVNLVSYDSDEDGIIDSCEWVIPHLSDAEFEFVIEISKAVHLGKNGEFLSDIYNETYLLDGTYSEAIYNGEYADVTFSSQLDNARDIILYARNSEGKRNYIEVYNSYNHEKITDFPVITETGKYTIYLAGMNGASDKFLLKVKNLDNDDSGYLEFDYIVDPAIAIYLLSPLNATKTSTAQNWFNANISGTNLKNATLFIWNVSNDAIINQTNVSISGDMNITNISVSLPYLGYFKWNYYGCDNLDNCAWNNTNWTINYTNYVSGCMVLDRGNTVYTQELNIIPLGIPERVACINITAKNVTFDCNGSTIINETFNATGIYSDQNYTTIKNCNVSVNRTGIYLVNSSYSSLINNTGKSYGINGIAIVSSNNNNLTNNFCIGFYNGIYLGYFSNNNNLINNVGISNSTFEGIRIAGDNNTLINNTGSSNFGDGIYLNGINLILVNNTGTSNFSNGIYIFSTKNSKFINQKAIGYLTGSYGINLDWNSANNTIQDCNNISGIAGDVNITVYSTNNTFINCPYRFNANNEKVDYISQLIKRWYYSGYVGYKPGYPINNANITVYNSSLQNQFNLTTNASGYTNITTVIDYVNINNDRKFYSSPNNYTFNLSYGIYSVNHRYNITNTTNIINDIFYLDNIFPSISFANPTPANNSMNYTVYINVSSSDNYLEHSVILDWNNSLVGWWRFNSSGDFNDSSSYGNNGSCSGINCPVFIFPGKYGGANYFNGNRSTTVNITIPASPSLNFGGKEATVSAWYYTNHTPDSITNSDGMTILGQRNDLYHNLQFYALEDSTSEPRIAFTFDTLNICYSNNIPPIGQWNFIAATYNGTQALIYINGVLDKTCNIFGSINNYNVPTYIGLDGSNQNFFNGSIDDVQIYKRALSPEEINASFNAGKYQYYHNFTGSALGNYSYIAYAQDLLGNVNTTGIRNVRIGNISIGVSVLNPSDISQTMKVIQNRFFNITLNVTCLNDYCGEINASLGFFQNFSAGYFYSTITSAGLSDITLITCDSKYVANADGIITSWQTYAKVGGSGMKFKVFRKAGSNYNFIFIGESNPENIVPGYNSFSTNIPNVQKGDCIGVYFPAGTSIQLNYINGQSLNKLGDIQSNQNYWNTLYNWIVSVGAQGTGGSQGLVSMNLGDLPFYTNVTNPNTTRSLNKGENITVVFFVNATGNVGQYKFFAFANSTSYPFIGNITAMWNVSIVSSSPSVINVDNTTFFGINTGDGQNVYRTSPLLITPNLAPSMTNFSFNFVANDDSGQLPGINPREDVSSYIEANISFGDKIRTVKGCRFVNNVGSINTKNYSCNISTYWSDEPQPNLWIIRVKIKSLDGTGSDVNGTQTMKFGKINGWNINPLSVNWTNNKITIGTNNIGSDNYLNITNNGNVLLVDRANNPSSLYYMTIRAYRLTGEGSQGGYYGASNFTGMQIFGPGYLTDDSCNAAGFNEGATGDIYRMTLNPDTNPPIRNSSILGFCAKTTSGIYPQSYSSKAGEEWQLNDYCNGCTN